ncbi:MAG: type IV secretory system conjugative DNA transfer family protein [Cyanobacteria bacterium P01_H01_bin.152]
MSNHDVHLLGGEPLIGQVEGQEVSSSSSVSTVLDSLGGAFDSLKGTNGIILLVMLAVFVALRFLGGNKGKSGQIARGVLSGGKEKSRAKKRALKQIKEGKHNAVGLYIGSPKRNKTGKIVGGGKTLFLPDVQRGIAVAGAPGSGKTFSIINPVIRAALDEGHPVIVYDFKYPSQVEVLAAYAAKRGYDVRVFAPGYPESEVCNPLDFLRNADDALMARQIATVMNRNFALSANSSEDKFFADAGDQLTQAILQLAKGMPEPDLMTASAVLSLPNLPERILSAKELGDRGQLRDRWKMSHWVYLSFSQLLQLKDSEKTIAGVIGTASKVFSRFMAPELIAAFCGKTTLPIQLEGKQLVILGLDRRRRDAVAPLMETILHMMVTMNVTMQRKDPLLLALDELPTLYLPNLVQWLNENRSDGLCTMVGFQNIAQLERAYKREISRAILGGCATKALFNPQDGDSAKWFSDYIGDEEVTIKQKSKNSGGSGGTTRSVSDHLQKRAIVEPAQFNKLPTGKCVLISPGYSRKEETAIPLITQVKIPKADIEAEDWSASKWPKVLQKLKARSPQQQRDEATSRQQIAVRIAIAQELLPESGDEASDAGTEHSYGAVPPVLEAPVGEAKIRDPQALAAFSEVF